MECIRDIIVRNPIPRQITESSSKLLIWSEMDELPAPLYCQTCDIYRAYKFVYKLGERFTYKRERCQCDDFEDARREREYIAALTKNIYRSESGMSKELLAKSLDQLHEIKRTSNSKESRSLREAVEIAREYIASWPNVQTLVLSGDVGCGKTHIACSIGSVLIEDHSACVRFTNVPKLLGQIGQSFNYKGDDPPADPMPGLIDASLLIIDELAELSFGWQKDALYRLINSRYERDGVNVVTTNLRSLLALQDAIGARSMDRLLHNAIWVDIDAPSYRLAGYAERNRNAQERKVSR